MIVGEDLDDDLVVDLRRCGDGPHGTQQHVDVVEQAVDAVAECARLDHPLHVNERVARREVGEPMAKQRTVVGRPRRVERRVRGARLRIEDVGHRAQRALELRQLDRDDRRAERRHAIARRPHHRDDLGQHAHRDELFVPPDADALEVVARRGFGGRHGLPSRRRIAGIGAGDAVEQQRRVRHGARDRTDVVERCRQREHAVARHAPPGGFQADGAAPRGRQPDRRRRVGAERRAREAGRGRDGRPAGRAARRAIARGPRIPCGSRVGMVGDERELGHVELAEQDRARLLEPFDGGRGARGHVVAEDARRSAGRRHAGRVEQILHRNRHPMQRAERAALRDGLLRARRRPTRVLGGHVEIAVHLRIDARDAVEIGVDRLPRGYLTDANAARQATVGS
jgi:hypothetical protein